MEYLASKAYHFTVWSSDPELISQTNLTIRAHGKCTVARLLQYVHNLLVQQGDGQFTVGVNDIQFSYRNGALSHETQCQQIEPNYPGVIRLRIEKKTAAQLAQEGVVPLDYDADSFSKTSMLVQCNALSVEKVFKAKLDNVNMHSTVSHLAKLALENLNQYEQTREVNMCDVKEHTLSDVIALDISGRSHAICLSEATEDLTLSDLLGIDFSPSADAFCTLLCKVKHGQSEDGVTIEFVSEAKFTMQKMVVNTDTTVLDVKNFICSVYAHALRLQPTDIKLIYKGCILHELSGASNEQNRILKFITEPTEAKLHVLITHEYSEPGPGFWNELLFASDRFDFMPSRGTSNGNNNNNTTDHTNRNTNTAASLSQTEPPAINNSGAGEYDPNTNQPPTATLLNRAANFSNQSASQHSNHTQQIASSRSATPLPIPTRTFVVTPEVEVPVVTSNGLPVTRSFETYERITVNNQEYLVPQTKLDSEYYELKVGDKTVRLSKKDLVLGEGCMKLSANARSAVENAIGESILINDEQYNVDDELLWDTQSPSNNDYSDRERQAGGLLARINFRQISPALIFNWIISTVTGRSGALLFLAFHFFPILPFWLFTTITGTVITRLIWSKFELGKEVRKRIIGSFDELPQQEIEQIKTLMKYEKFPVEFFETLARNSKVSSELCNHLEQNEELVKLILQEIKQNPVVEEQLSQNEQLATQYKYILKQFVLFTTTSTNNENKGKFKHLYYDMFRSMFENLDGLLLQELHSLPPWAAPVVSEMRKYNLKANRTAMTKKVYCNIFLDVYRPWNFFSDNTMMRYVVPNPRTDNIITCILKNCLLFVLLFVPNCERQFEEIIEERLIEQSQEEEHVQLA
ncbi:unnamed protein product [Kluyveromyces dobzhanskii CBS 2104]|uniref:WGS project CCBQ000000000 data, contig 00105 n=1 Tax=Kluyveromyces dobzhanskii CBS 2104 TaxID=1427455 RepID=A0A0A8L1K6_9SACH|nr:unnamed protein product [Kluyveromyces dobzhanskii CBS 2104]